MKKHLIIFLLLCSFAFLVGCDRNKEYSLTIIQKAEAFKQTHGRYPNNLSEIGLTETEKCPCYQLNSDSSFDVWYPGNIGFFSTRIYNSRTKTWELHK
jgi:hypothetical protein